MTSRFFCNDHLKSLGIVGFEGTPSPTWNLPLSQIYSDKHKCVEMNMKTFHYNSRSFRWRVWFTQLVCEIWKQLLSKDNYTLLQQVNWLWFNPAPIPNHSGTSKLATKPKERNTQSPRFGFSFIYGNLPDSPRKILKKLGLISLIDWYLPFWGSYLYSTFDMEPWSCCQGVMWLEQCMLLVFYL